MTFKGTLYSFQEEAVEKMIESQSLLVAYEMGLGKTVIAIAAIEQLIDEGEIGGGFIICPNSLKLQWERMLLDYTGPAANVIVVTGDARHRQEQYRDYMNGGAEYLIFNPEAMVNDWEIIRKLPRDFIVADEIQWAKGFKAKRSKKLKRLRATYRWGLTGQPIENRAEEMFSIMQWIDPTVLGDFRNFDRAFIVRDHFGRVKVYKNLPTLHRILSDTMVRRTREEVKDQLPAVTESVIPVEMDAVGARLYRRIVHDLEDDLAEAINTWGNFSLSSYYQGEEQGEARGRIMSKLMCLRMLCDHPELLRLSAGHYAGLISKGNRQGSAYAYELKEAGRLERTLKAPKIEAAVELIGEILTASPKNKIVAFSYFKDFLDLIQTATAPLTKAVLFTGDVTPKDREQARQTFANDPGTRLFLSSDAGGVGLDLPYANYLISLDLPWSSGAYSQRQSRIIRLSSVFPEVTLVSLQVSGSIEEYQHQLLQQKKKVADAVVDGKGISPKGKLSLNLQSLSAFLRESEV